MAGASIHETWSSRLAFLLAAVGAAVGLGNIWRFPYLAGENGGSAFVLLYIACIVVVGLPILIAEITLGRRGGLSPINTMRVLAGQERRHPLWQGAGWLAVTTIFLASSFYMVVAGWVLAYVPLAASGTFAGIEAGRAQGLFDALLADPLRMVLWYAIFIALTVFVVASGIRDGLERAVRLLMPCLFALLAVLVGYAAVAGEFAEGVAFLFAFDPSRITPAVVLDAIGQAFFTLGVAQAVMMTYAAYIPRHVSLTRAAVSIAVADLIVAMAAALVIFPLVFANDLEPASGPGLVFITLPIAFGHMPAGTLFGTLFFVLVSIAALTSTISGVEPVVSWAEEHKGWRRKPVAIVTGLAIWLVGLVSVFSFNILRDVTPLQMFAVFEGKRFFDLVEYLTVNVLMPINGLLIAVFAGWMMSKSSMLDELDVADGSMFRALRFLLRYVAPAAVLAIFAFHLT